MTDNIKQNYCNWKRYALIRSIPTQRSRFDRAKRYTLAQPFPNLGRQGGGTRKTTTMFSPATAKLATQRPISPPEMTRTTRA